MIKDSDRWASLHDAAEFNMNSKVISTLIKCGTKAKAKNISGNISYDYLHVNFAMWEMLRMKEILNSTKEAITIYIEIHSNNT